VSAPISQFAVRILKENQSPAGAGVLIANGHVLTCAHVIRAALGVPRESDEPPTSKILLDFPWLPSAGRLLAKIKVWHYDPKVVSADIAVLELETVPEGCSPAMFSAKDEIDGHDFAAYGYTGVHNGGIWSKGTLGYDNASGLLQMTNFEQAGYQVQPGFSGGPVWDVQLKAVVGIVVTNELKAELRTSFLIPTRLISAVYDGLGESILSPTHELMAAEAGSVGSHIGPHVIVIREGPGGRLRWSGGIRPGQVGELWRGRTDFQIAYEPNLNRHRGVADALLRVAIHGAGGTLYVTDPDKWKERSKLAVNSCLGTRWNYGSPTIGMNGYDVWRLRPYSEYVDCPLPINDDFAPQDIETIIHAAMDLKLLDNLAESLSSALEDEDFNELGFGIERRLSQSMWEMWRSWDAILRAEPEVLGHFFRVTLSKAAPDQHRFARNRAGLKTLVPCLLRGVVFALAIRVCLQKDFRPCLGSEFENIKASDGMGHLCGLELIETISIVQKVGSLSWDTNYVLLPHYTDSGDDIPEICKNLLTSGGSYSRFDDPQPLTPLFITNEGAFARALAEGSDSLKAHLVRVVARWQARQEAELAQSMGDASNAFQ
jgi:hypothetical protein